MKRCATVLLITASCASLLAFEKIAYIDSLDFSEVFETETVEASAKIIDCVLGTGATTLLWRNQSGSIPCYPSAEEAEPLKEPPLDKRRLPYSRPVMGWTRYDDCGVDLIRAAADACQRRGVRFGIHMTTEENHSSGWTFSPWNLEHPQFWCCRIGDTPHPGTSSLSHPEVRAHKLRLFDELLAMKPEMVTFDLHRSGGWSPEREYVGPVEAEWRKLYACEPPADWRDPRWLALVAKNVERYYVGLRQHADATGRKVEFVLTLERVGVKEDHTYVSRAIDWRKYLREGVIDAVAVASVALDWTDPWGSTARIYSEIVHDVKAIGRGKVYFPIMSYNFTGRPGYPEYAKRCGITERAAVEKLLGLAKAAGGDGITMEVVDYGNYSPEVCEAIRNFK